MSNTAHARTTEHAADDRQIAVRLPAHLLDRIEQHRDAMSARSPGVKITTSDAVRALLIVGLDAA